MGLQYCNCDVEIKQNIDGCSGYNLRSNDRYIITIYNLDGAHPVWGNNIQMSPKPMRIINQ